MSRPVIKKLFLVSATTLLVGWVLVTAIAAWRAPDHGSFLPGSLLVVSILALALGIAWKLGGDPLYFFLVLVLAGIGGFAWLTQHPESRWLKQAQDWPVVGELASRFREAYLGRETTSERTAEVIQQEPPVPVSEHLQPVAPQPESKPEREAPQVVIEQQSWVPPAAPPVPDKEKTQIPKPPTAPSRSIARAPLPIPEQRIQYVALDWVWFLPGNRILASATADGDVQAQLGALAYLPILRQEGKWAEVVYQDERGWIDTLWEPAHKRRHAHRGIVRHHSEPVLNTDPSNLRTARKILGIKRSQIKVGDYKLYTNVDDVELLAFLNGAAIAAEQGYFARYARLPSGDPFRSAVLFAKEADYRLYSEETSKTHSSTRVGHAGGGMLAFYAEGQSRMTLARTLVHEITHLLNDRSIAWDLPTWLEEGIASDLGSVWVEDSPDIESDARLGRRQGVEIQGFESRLLYLGEVLEADQLPQLWYLLAFDREMFHRPDVERYAYAHSAALIRYLLDGEEGQLADGFRAFLRKVSAGRKADLLALVGKTKEELDQGFREWLSEQVQVTRERLAR